MLNNYALSCLFTAALIYSPCTFTTTISWELARKPLFDYAAKGALEEVRKYIPDAHCPVDWQDELGRTASWYAAKNGHILVVEHLLAHLANPDLKDKNGISPKEIARRKGHKEIVALLSRPHIPE